MTDIVVTAATGGHVDDEVTIIVDGQEITGWEDVEVTLRCEGFPNSFAIGASTSSDARVGRALRAGAACSVRLGNDVVVTGYLDRVSTAGSKDTHAVHLAGRGKTQDLVDCSAEWPTHQMIDGDALEISTNLAKPYGLSVELGTGAAAGPKVNAFLLNYGETGAEIVQRVARNAGLLAYETAEGVLVLGTAGGDQAASGIVYGENVEAYAVETSMDERFSEIVCCAQAMDTTMELGGSDFYDTERDPNVPRHRLRYQVIESVAEDPQTFTVTKAMWEVARRAGRAAVVHATVDSWRDKAGKPWTPNTTVPVKLPGDGDVGSLVLSEVTFRRSNESGTTADMMLMPATAFVPEPIVLNPVSTADIDTPPAAWTWLANLIGIGRVTLVDDADELQRVQVTEGAIGSGFADRILDKVRRVTEFGFASAPPIDSEAVMIRRGGDRSKSLVVATSHRPSRPRNLQPGDTGIYDVRGTKVMLTANGLLIDCAGLPAIVQNATTVTVKASDRVRIEAAIVEVTGDVISRADGQRVSLNDLRDAYDAHKHIGVQTGSGSTGLTDHLA